ncbi:MAG: hypothetical protein ACK5IM_04530 [Demequina sp.]|uniref:hypothetical protein n=1 Tax=Demequina sp. TaxID=2050685 RepID=UPI003A835A0D
MTPFHSRQWSFQNVFAAVTLGSSLVAVVVLFFIADAWGEAPWLAWPTLALLAATLVIPMSVEVGAHEVVVRLAGCTVRRIELTAVLSAQRRTYRPLHDFGGWGLRWGMNRRNARAYTTTGSTAVVLTLRDASEVYLGVDNEQGLLDTLSGRGIV